MSLALYEVVLIGGAIFGLGGLVMFLLYRAERKAANAYIEVLRRNYDGLVALTEKDAT